MNPELPHPHTPQHIGAIAIRFLATNDYDRTTAGELADAVGMSRSTFFRRFGSKDDVIFSDHDHAFQQLNAEIADAEASETASDVPETLSRTITQVFSQLTRDVEAAQLRFQMVRDTPALRDRELVLSNRYTRVFVQYLQRSLPNDSPSWVAHALGAAAVSLHNAALRSWLRQPDPRIIGSLDRDLRELCKSFALTRTDNAHPTQPTQVLVASYPVGTSPQQVLTAIQQQLR